MQSLSVLKNSSVCLCLIILPERSKYLVKIVQTPPPDVDVAMKKGKNSSSLTKRQIELKRMYKIMSENFFVSDDYVSIVHVLPHFQVKLLHFRFM